MPYNWGPYYIVPSEALTVYSGIVQLREQLDEELLHKELEELGFTGVVERITNPWYYRKKDTETWIKIGESEDKAQNFPVTWDVSGMENGKYEVLGLLFHAIHLEKEFNVGPHTISFPRLQPAQGVKIPENRLVSDEDFKKLVAVIRLSVPYTGMILTAREAPELRREVIELGCSQIDAGSRIELKGYTEHQDEQESDRQQFKLGDTRSLDEVMRELVRNGYTPSFCTACYRLGRTGEHFMELAIPGFIHNYCMPNAILTLKEYLEDYASKETKKAGEASIQKALSRIGSEKRKKEIIDRLKRVEKGERDLYF